MPGRVPNHRPHGQATPKPHDGRSRQEDKNFYASARWIRLRDLVRAEDPLCRECRKEGLCVPGEAVDHITPRKTDPSLAYERSNLRHLCKRHHNQVRADENK